MTGQISDSFLYKGDEYSLAGVDGTGLFNPEDFELEILPGSTACWRGYHAFYVIKDNKLVLRQLLINVKGDPIKINNKKPKKTKNHMFKYSYPLLDLPMNFTGSVRIAKDFIRELYIHMGFQSTSSYETVSELHFKDGEFVKEEDLSQQMAEIREVKKTGPTKPRAMDDDDPAKWISDSFSLKYEEKRDTE